MPNLNKLKKLWKNSYLYALLLSLGLPAGAESRVL
jgi:hypothetical protein